MSTEFPNATIPIRALWQPRHEPLGSLPGCVHGVVFDTGDVLYDATVWRRWLLKVLARLGLSTNYRSFYRVWDQDYLAGVHRGQGEFWEEFCRFLLAAGLSRAQIDEVLVACRARRQQWMATARPLPGVCSTLARLSQAGVPLAAISDSELTRDAIEAQLHRVGLSDAFQAVICSTELGHVKPEPEGYLAALATLGLAAHDCVFVGHDREELEAATRLGMQTAAFNYDSDASADVYLGRFDILADLALARRPLTAAG